MTPAPEPTDLEREREEQRNRWRMLPSVSGVNAFHQLMFGELLPPEQQQDRQVRAFLSILNFALRFVPYYREKADRLNLSTGDFQTLDDLRKFPVLTRRNLQEHFAALQAESLPRGMRVTHITRSSGSTGEPVTVRHTAQSSSMFPLLKQRELRWFRWDPRKRLAAIRTESELPFREETTQRFGEARYCRAPAWPYVGAFFETGPFFGLSLRVPVETQRDWLAHIKPRYLTMIAARLEHLALCYQSGRPPPGLGGLLAISQQVTEGMRGRIEGAFALPLQQNYGLNEVGIVAARCPEGGRYHVHAEHCLVEIVDGTGQHCGPGESGHLLVTAFANAAMPLIRYDTGDWAEALEGPCPCGRTLPSFGRILGRYNNIIALPEGTSDCFAVSRGALEEMPPELLGNVKQYQMHLYKDGRFELRVAVRGRLPSAFSRRILDAWQEAAGGAWPLTIEEVDNIPVPENGKYQTFTSDYFSDPAAQKTPEDGTQPGGG